MNLPHNLHNSRGPSVRGLHMLLNPDLGRRHYRILDIVLR